MLQGKQSTPSYPSERKAVWKPVLFPVQESLPGKKARWGMFVKRFKLYLGGGGEGGGLIAKLDFKRWASISFS